MNEELEDLNDYKNIKLIFGSKKKDKLKKEKEEQDIINNLMKLISKIIDFINLKCVKIRLIINSIHCVF